MCKLSGKCKPYHHLSSPSVRSPSLLHTNRTINRYSEGPLESCLYKKHSVLMRSKLMQLKDPPFLQLFLSREKQQKAEIRSKWSMRCSLKTWPLPRYCRHGGCRGFRLTQLKSCWFFQVFFLKDDAWSICCDSPTISLTRSFHSHLTKCAFTWGAWKLRGFSTNNTMLYRNSEYSNSTLSSHTLDWAAMHYYYNTLRLITLLYVKLM